jgi:hypothetical protein
VSLDETGLVLRTAEWEGFSGGQRVIVLDHDGHKMRGVAFWFRAHCRNRRTGAEWIEVFGGRNGHQTSRAFSLDRVTMTAADRRAMRVRKS